MRIYITHCSAKKNSSLKGTSKKTTPDKLYTAAPTQRFMKKCKEMGVKWAIFSDLYGAWFPKIKFKWYEKNPNTGTEKEFRNLLNNFDQTLQKYSDIWFYYNPGRFHPLYKELIKKSKLRNRIKLFTHISEIV